MKKNSTRPDKNHPPIMEQVSMAEFMGTCAKSAYSLVETGTLRY